MAYRRRYLSGQSATTVVIAEGAITTDKIVDGAVTHPKLAPGSVDSEKVIDSSLKSEDIQDGQIKAVDLAPNAVTTDKILDGAVTTQKLEASIQGIARPLTPGVDTAEIQDAKVTLAKLAPDSVDASKIKSGAVGPTELAAAACEESRIKDGAISTAKIAGGAINSTKIGVGAVDGSAILNGSVGVTELATDSVETIKIKDLAVSEPKLNNLSIATRALIDNAVTEPKLNGAALSLRHMESYGVRNLNVHEDFCGSGISDRWRKRIDAGGYVYWITATPMRGLALGTPATTGKKVILDWAEKGINLDGNKTTVSFWIPGTTTDRTYQKRELGLMHVFDESSYILFTAEDVGGAVPNWFARCKETGAETSQDTGIAVTEATQVLAIEYVSDSEVNFYIDGILVKTIATNIPSGTVLDPWIAITARENAVKGLYVQMMDLISERPAYA